jgi:hypothetical protein
MGQLFNSGFLLGVGEAAQRIASNIAKPAGIM